MSLFIFRNFTLEPFFRNAGTQFSGYGDVSSVPVDVDEFLWFWTFPQEISSSEARDVVDGFLTALESVVARVPAEKKLQLVEMCSPVVSEISTDDTRVSEAISSYNSELRKIAARGKNISIVSVSPEILQDVDWRFYFMAQIPFSPKRELKFSDAISNFVKKELPVPAIRKKCLVLDLDGTLWDGILGEDGAIGIKIAGDYPGNAFLFFQKKISELAESGIILAIASKNNFSDVKEVFEKNPFMVLRWEMFSAFRIGWEEKSLSLKEIAKELNIGLDSLVFIDNEPRERELIRQILPEVEVPDFPAQAYDLPVFFKKLLEKYFRTEKLTREDLDKTAQYRGNAERAQLAQKCRTFEDYLESLQTTLEVAKADDLSFPRLAQLSQKTNQFNLTTRRYTEAELRERAVAGAQIFSLRVRDRFGDCGIVGLAIFLHGNTADSLVIDSLLLSCRVLGRGIENTFLQELLSRLHAEGINSFFAEYIPSKKNSQTADFYLKNGFEAVPESAGKFLKKL